MKQLQSLLGTFYVRVGEMWMASKLVGVDGDLDAVTLGGGVSLGRFSDMSILTTMKSGAATRRLLDAGVLKHGRMNYLPSSWMASAQASVYPSMSAFLASRYGEDGWVTDPEQLDKGRVLLARVQQIEAEEQQAA